MVLYHISDVPVTIVTGVVHHPKISEDFSTDFYEHCLSSSDGPYDVYYL